MANPWAFVVFFISKLIRYSFFMLFLYLFTSNLTSLGDYSASEMLIFYLIFNLVDTSSQMLFREVYRFRPLVISGGFDLVLSKPFPPLLRVLVGGPDFIDLSILVVLLAILAKVALLDLGVNIFTVFVFGIFISCSLLISAALHIFVLGFGIISLSVDHLIMVYRDITSLMRIPMDFFSDGLKLLFTFILPIGVAFTFPAKALIRPLSLLDLVISVLVSSGLFMASLKFWKFSLKNYQSAGG